MRKFKGEDNTPCCKNCRYFFPDEVKGRMKTELGICRRYPPTILGIDEDGITQQDWPTVTNQWICGEYYTMLNS
jgi:hypothetical protein